jgi:hypothetical protein
MVQRQFGSNLCIKIGAGRQRKIIEPHGEELRCGFELEDEILPVEGEFDAIKETGLRERIHVLLHIVRRERLPGFETRGGEQLVAGVVGSALELDGFWREFLCGNGQNKAGSGKRHKESREWESHDALKASKRRRLAQVNLVAFA